MYDKHTTEEVIASYELLCLLHFCLLLSVDFEKEKKRHL